MKRILIPIDFSKGAYNSIEYAVQLYKNEPCTFYLINTIYNADFILHSSIYEVYRNNSQSGLMEVKEQIEKEYPNTNHTIEIISSYNTLSEEIKIKVEKREIDMVVMSTEGGSGGVELLFGTYTAHAIRIAKCPILVIPAKSHYLGIKHILFPSDYKLTLCESKLALLHEIALAHKPVLHIMHESFGEQLTPLQEESRAAIDGYFKEVDHHFHSMSKDSVLNAIYGFNQKHPTDLVVMVKNKHTFLEKILFKSTVNEVSYYVKIPFLVLPSENYEV
ncbi:MAG: universal stress protein [Leeuwenhoekiella sp.]